MKENRLVENEEHESRDVSKPASYRRRRSYLYQSCLIDSGHALDKSKL